MRSFSAFIASVVLAGCASGAPFEPPASGGSVNGVASTETLTSLYVADSQSVTVYGVAKCHYVRRILDPSPTALAIDAEGNLFAADFDKNTVTVYARHTGSVVRVITQGLHEPRALAFDGAGNL